MKQAFQSSAQEPNSSQVKSGPSLEKADAELEESIKKLNNTLDTNMIQLYHAYRKKGMNTEKIVAYLKQHGIPIPK